MKIAVLLMITAFISLFAACNLTDTDEEHSSFTIEQDALFSKDKGPHNLGQGEFYPLAIGNTWKYTGSFSIQTGTGPAYSIPKSETRTIIGTEELFGREYMLEEQVILDGSLYGPDDTITYWVRHRQDRAGLYAADVAMNTPPAEESGTAGLSSENPRKDLDKWNELWSSVVDGLESVDPEAAERAKIAHFKKIKAVNELLGRVEAGRAPLTGPPGGILPDEIQRLKYPLHTRQEWIIRAEPLFYTVVEGMDVLDLPAGRMNGWRIFIHNEFLGKNDIVHLWYGRKGFLCMEVHLETEDNTFGDTIISDETLYLVDYDLEGKGTKDDNPEDGKKADSRGSLLSDL